MMAWSRLRQTALMILLAGWLLVVAGSGTFATSPLPTVFRDNDLTIRAAITRGSDEQVHSFSLLGDRLTLAIQVGFDPDRVRIESLDGVFFRQVFAEKPGIRLIDTGTETVADQGVVLHGDFHFQILGCPQGMGLSCLGSKRYDLPLMSLEFQLLDETGQVAGTKAAEFVPRPHALMVTPILPLAGGQLQSFTVYFPDNAMPGPLSVADRIAANRRLGLLPLIIGIGTALALLIGPVTRRSFAPDRQVAAQTRWQQVWHRLRSDASADMPGPEFIDHLRCCLVWYCTDNLGVNPYTWMGMLPADTEGHAHLRELFIGILAESDPDTERRRELLDQLEVFIVGNRQ